MERHNPVALKVALLLVLLLLLILLASCKGIELVPTVGCAYHEDTDTTSAMVAVSFVPSSTGDEVPRNSSFWDGPIGSNLRPSPSAYTTDQERPSKPFDQEGNSNDGQPVTIETPWGTFKVAGISIAAIAAACIVAQRSGIFSKTSSPPA